MVDRWVPLEIDFAGGVLEALLELKQILGLYFYMFDLQNPIWRLKYACSAGVSLRWVSPPVVSIPQHGFRAVTMLHGFRAVTMLHAAHLLLRIRGSPPTPRCCSLCLHYNNNAL